MMDYRGMEQRLSDTLGLGRRPVAVTFRDSPPAGLTKFAGSEPSGCSFWRIAEGGRAFYTVASDHYNCAIGSHRHRIPLPAERAPELEQTLSFMTGLGYIKMDEVPGIPQLARTPQSRADAPRRGVGFLDGSGSRSDGAFSQGNRRHYYRVEASELRSSRSGAVRSRCGVTSGKSALSALDRAGPEGPAQLASISQGRGRLPHDKRASRRSRLAIAKGRMMDRGDGGELELRWSAPRAEWGEINGSSHLVQFYEEEGFLLDAISRFIGPALRAGDAGVVIATEPHRERLTEHLVACGFDVAAVREQGRLVMLDAAETLSKFMIDGWPDEARFAHVVGGTLARAAAAAHYPRVRAFGEMVALLYAEGRPEVAIRLEELWNDLATGQPFSLLCAYPLSAFPEHGHGAPFLRICGEHSHVFPSESYAALDSPAARLRAITGLQQKVLALETESATERQQGELVRAHLAAIVDFSDDAIISKSLDGIITSWNRAAERMFGWTAAEAVGRHITLIIPEDRRAEEDDTLARLRRGEMLDHFETVRITKDGRLLSISLSVSPIKDAAGHIVGASKIARDITEQKRLQAELTRKLEELAEADRRKDEFLAMLGHELRNPLSAVRNAVVVARLDPSRRERALDLARRQADQLGRLVDDLLDVARITRGRMTLHFESVRLASIVDRAIETTRDLVEMRGHALARSLPDERIEVQADPTRLEQVVVNLIRNAAKYTEPGGRVEVIVQREGEQAVLRVRDNGIGIAPEMLPRVFDLFAQSSRTLDRSEGGLGIGLTIVHRLVELHGGRVEVRSEGLGKGAEFRVSLPCLPASSREVGPAASAAEIGGGRAKVLVVEDNPDVGEGLTMLLELLGHRVRVVQDGLAALDAVRSHVPDIMLIDIGLPGMNGYELARRIREDRRLEGVVLVALTGYGREQDKQAAIAAGFDDHLVKPMSGEAFQRLLGRVGRLEPWRGVSGTVASG